MKRKVIILLIASMVLTFGSVGTVFAEESATQTVENAVHEHTWGSPYYVVDKEAEYEWVTVVDTPEQTVEYNIYRMYWYTTGTWEETRDPDRFQIWSKSEDGGLYTIYNPYENPEDNPLFIGYDSNGNATYTNDHSIIGPYYETIPAVTHEEYQEVSPEEGHNEYECTVCGEIQNSDTGEVIKPGTLTEEPNDPSESTNSTDAENTEQNTQDTESNEQDSDNTTEPVNYTEQDNTEINESKAPQTGDTANLISLATLAGSAVTGGTAIGLRRKFKK